MKVIKEDIENLERYIGNSKVDVHAELPLVMADAYSASKKAQEEIDKEMKPEKLDIKDEKVIGAKKQPVPKKPEEAKINLEESLFEDIFYPHRSADILIDMIDDGQFDYQDKLEALLKDIIYLVDDNELSSYLKKKGIYSEALKEESLSEDYRDKNWKLVELIQDYIRQGHIDKDEFIDKILQWYYMEPTFNSFLISNNIFSEDEMDELISIDEDLKESLFEDYKSYGPNANRLIHLTDDLSSRDELVKDLIDWIENKFSDDELLEFGITYGYFPEVEESLKESIVGNAKNWLIDKEGKSPKEAEKIINNSSPDELEKIALKWINKDKNESLKEAKSSIKDFLTALSNCKTVDDLQVLRNRFDSLKTATRQDAKTFNSAWNKKRKALKEARKASPFIDSEGNSYGDEDRSLDDMDDTLNDPWTIVYNEIAPENPNWRLKTKIPDIPTWKRYDQDHLEFDYDDNIIIHAEKEEDFDLAKRIANEYGLEFKGPRQRKFDKDFIATIIMPKVD